MAIIFDTSFAPALYIVLDPAQHDYSAQEIYSRWKEWVLAGNANWPPAFRTVGGDPVGESEIAPRFFFIRNDLGWNIRKPEATEEYLIDGNLIGEDVLSGTITPPIGAFSPTLRIRLTNVAGINTRAFWEAVIADFDAGTAGYIISRTLELAEGGGSGGYTETDRALAVERDTKINRIDGGVRILNSNNP